MAMQTFEQRVAIGRVAQAALLTASAAGDLISFKKLNASLADPALSTEDDTDELGKGHEFAEDSFVTSWDVSGQLDKYLTSEAAGILLAYALGKSESAAGAGSGSFVHTMGFSDPITDEIDMVPFTVVEQINRSGGSPVDRSLIGCVVEDVTISLTSGPTRAASKIVANIIGTGKFTTPSGITMPAITAEHRLPSAGMTLTVNGVDYVGTKTIESVEISIKNNVRTDSGHYPGSGFQTTGDGGSGSIRGRMEHGKRAVTLRFVARIKADSAELTKLKAQTEGTAALTVVGPLIAGSTYHKLEINFPRIRFASVRQENADNVQTVAVDCTVLYDATDGPIEVLVTNEIETLAGEA